MTATKPRNIAVTLEVFIRKDGKFLMLHRGAHKRIMPNIWMAPGGHREFNEGLFTCARREVSEETNLEIKNLRIGATGNAYLTGIDQEFFFHFILADYASGELKTSLDDGEFAWLTPAEIMELPTLLPELKKVFPLMMRSQTPISFSAEYDKNNQMTSFILEQP